MKKSRAVMKNRILSLFLALCMVVTLLPVNTLTVDAAVSEKYQVGGVFLDMDGTTTAEDGSWTWDGSTSTLTFTKNVKITSNAETTTGYLVNTIGLPGGTKIVVNDGVRAEITGLKGDALYCDGNLTVTGNGSLNLYGSVSGTLSADGTTIDTGYDADTTVGSGVVCRGIFTIGDGTTEPLVYVSSKAYTAHTLEIGSDIAVLADEPVVNIQSGQLSVIAEADENNGKIYCAGTNKNLQLSNHAVMYYPSENIDNVVILQADATVQTVVDGAWYYATDEEYVQITYDKNDSKGGHAEYAPTKILVRVKKGQQADLTATAVPDANYKFLGWNTAQDATTALDSYPAETTGVLWAIFKELVKQATPNATINYETGKLTGLTVGETYIIKADGVADWEFTATGSEDITAYYGKTISVIKVGASEEENSDAQVINVGAVAEAPAVSNFTVTEAINGNQTASIAGITSTYEYSTDGGANWTTGDGNAVTVNPESTILIRTKATDSAPASESQTITTKAAQTQEGTPAATVNYETGKITGLTPNATYTFTIGTTVKTVTADANGEAAASNYYGKTISIVKNGNGETTYDSQAQALIINAKPATPTAADFTVIDAENGAENATIKGITDKYEYSLDGGNNWTTGTGSDVEVAAGNNVVVRVKATDSAPASDKYIITTSAAQTQEPTPEAKIDYANGKIENLTANAVYTITVDGEETTVTADANGKIDATPYYGKEISIVKNGNGDTTYDSQAQTLTVGAKPATPVKENFVVTEAADGETQATVSGITSGYEFSKDGGQTWLTGNGEDVKVDAGSEILVRVPASDNAPASDNLTLTTNSAKTQETTPQASVDYANDVLTNLVPNAGYTIIVEGNSYNENADANGMMPAARWYGKTISLIKEGDGTTTYNSEAQSITLSNPQTAPDADDFTVTEATDGKQNAVISGITSDYEYSLDDGETWTQGTGEDVEVEAGEDIVIRKKATDEAAASESVIITTKAAQTAETTPNATVDYANDKLTNLTPNATYTISSNGVEVEVTADENGAVAIENYYGEEISVIKNGNGDTTYDSEAQNITLAAKPETPSMDDFEIGQTEDGSNQAVIKGITDKYEYSKDNGETWTTGDGSDVYVGEDESIDIRVKATEEAPASAKLTITVTVEMTPEATPKAEVDYTNGVLTNLVPNAEYTISCNGVAEKVTANANGKTDVTKYYGKDITIVKNGDGVATTDSEAQSLSINAKPETPSKDSFTVDEAGAGETSAIIKGIGSDYEYSTDGGNTWKTGDGSDVIVEAGKSILIRKKATAGSPASETIIITTKAPEKAQEVTPNATVDYQAEKLTGLVANADYTIVVDGKTVSFKADANGKTDVSMYYGKTISLVKKGNGTTTTDSAAQSIAVNAKMTAPTEDQFTVEQAGDESGNVIIKNVTSDYEYSTDNGANWISGTGSDITVQAGATILIRKKATKTTPASEPIKIVGAGYTTEAAMDSKITSANTDKGDVAGSTFAKLRLKAVGKNKQVKLTWKKVKDADGYILYGSQCGKSMKKIKTFEGASKVKYTQKKLKKGKYYKYMVVAYKNINGQKFVIASSKSAHAVTTGGKYGNPKKVSVKPSKVSIKKGKSKKLKCSYVIENKKKARIHIAKFRYESSNTKVATVNKKGVVKGKSKGKATIYIYAQNGIYKTVRVTVK